MRKLSILLMLVLVGCEPSLDSSSTYEEVVDTLTENFNENREQFERLIELYQEENGSDYGCWRSLLDGSIDFTISELYEKKEGYEKVVWMEKSTEVCKLQEATRAFLSTQDDNAWGFGTFENSEGRYLNIYMYVYRIKMPSSKYHCIGINPRENKEKGWCLIPLSEHWSIDYSFIRYPETRSYEEYKSKSSNK